MRNSIFLSYALIVLSFFVFASCAPVTPVVSSLVTPPSATLEINGQTQTAGIGPYCWSNGHGRQTCADMDGLPTAHDPLVTDTPFTGHFHLPLDEPPESLYVSVMAVTAFNDLTGGAGETRLWKFTSGWSSELPLKNDVEYEFMDSPSLYLIQLNARWKDWGNVAYGFLVQVGNVDNGLAAVTPGTPYVTPAPLALQILSPLTRLGKGTVSSLAVSPDGEWLAVATPLGVYMYDTATRNEIWSRQFTSMPQQLAFSPDSSRLAIGLAGSLLPVIDTRTGQYMLELAGEENIHGVWSPDGRYILTSGDCEQVLIWDAESGEITHVVQSVKCNNATPGYINAVWSWDGKRIYVNSSGYGYVLAWDAVTFQPLEGYQPQPPENAFGFGISPSPTQDIFALNNWNSVAIINGKTGKTVKVLTAEDAGNLLDDFHWSPDGKRLLAANLLWDVDSGNLLKNFDDFSGLAWMPDGDTLVGTSIGNNSIKAISITSGETLFSLAGFGALSGNGLTPFWDGDSLLTFDGFNEIRWNPRTSAILEQSPAAKPDWLSEYWRPRSPDGTRLATGTSVTDAATGAELVYLADNADRQRDVIAWSPDGARLVSGDSLGLTTTVIWDARTGAILLTLPLEADGNPFLGALAWAPDGKWIAAGGSLMNPGNGFDNGMLALWDAQTGEQLHLLTAGMNDERIMSIAWSPDGHWLAAGMYSGRIVLWDMHRYIPTASLNGHVGSVMALSWSADSARLASSSLDGTVLIWELP